MIEHFPDIGVTVLSRWIFNCYIIHDGGEGRPFVVDLGVPMHVPTLEQQLLAHGSHIAELTGVVATHGHSDHVGGLPTLRDLMAIAIALPQGVADLLDGAPLRTPGPREVAHILPVMADQPFELAPLRELAAVSSQIGYDQTGVRFPFIADQWLAEGDRVDGAPDWEVLHTPGHTDDSISLYNATSRVLLSGDAVLAVDRRAWFNPEYVDAELSAATEDRLRTLDVEYLLPGHGRAVAGSDVLGAAFSFRERPPDDSTLQWIRRIYGRHRHARRGGSAGPA